MAEPYQYALLRVVPRIDRGERLNAGVVVFSRRHGGFLAARTHLDAARLAALDAEADAGAIVRLLAEREAVAAGDVARGGAVAAMEPSERFGWLVAPSSTVVQPSQVHTGLCEDPQACLERLFRELVL